MISRRPAHCNRGYADCYAQTVVMERLRSSRECSLGLANLSQALVDNFSPGLAASRQDIVAARGGKRIACSPNAIVQQFARVFELWR